MTLTEFNFRNRKNINLVKQFILITILLFLIFKPEIKTIINPISTTKTIVKRIEGKETQIQIFTKTIGNEKFIISQLNKSISIIQTQLDSVKIGRDTVQIIQIQDTLIYKLYTTSDHYKKTIDFQDSIIIAQRYVINSKDALIAISKQDIKRIKRQRNTAALLAVAGGVFFFIK